MIPGSVTNWVNNLYSQGQTANEHLFGHHKLGLEGFQDQSPG